MSHKNHCPEILGRPQYSGLSPHRLTVNQVIFFVALLLLHKDGKELQEFMMDWTQYLVKCSHLVNSVVVTHIGLWVESNGQFPSLATHEPQKTSPRNFRTVRSNSDLVHFRPARSLICCWNYERPHTCIVLRIQPSQFLVALLLLLKDGTKLQKLLTIIYATKTSPRNFRTVPSNSD